MRGHRIVPWLLLACSPDSGRTGGDGFAAWPGVVSVSAGSEGGSSSGATTTGTDTGTTKDPTTGAPAASSSGASTAGPPAPKFDVGADGPLLCQDQTVGVHCDDKLAFECDGLGAVVGTHDCAPSACLEGTGCVACVPGQYSCQGDKVMICADVAPPVWEVAAVCDPAAGQGCDLALGACTILLAVGGVAPTGVYYQFADFQLGASAFKGGCDVDSWGDRLYVLGLDKMIDVYRVTLVDSDGDGLLEPNQHPDNPAATGPIEARELTLLETIPAFGPGNTSTAELFAAEDRLFMGGPQLTEYVLGNGATSVLSLPPPWLGNFSQIGHDDVNDVWYAANETARRVFQYDKKTGAWGIAFLFPTLAGDHMDGLEVVTDPNTGTPYVYVSDMTSDFIAQYRLDPQLGWVQENLFSYDGTQGSLVEGMGYGALNHFWAASGTSLYEIGGGDLADYTEPPG